MKRVRGKMGLWTEYQCALQVSWDCLLNPPEMKEQAGIPLKHPTHYVVHLSRDEFGRSFRTILNGI